MFCLLKKKGRCHMCCLLSSVRATQKQPNRELTVNKEHGDITQSLLINLILQAFYLILHGAADKRVKNKKKSENWK